MSPLLPLPKSSCNEALAYALYMHFHVVGKISELGTPLPFSTVDVWLLYYCGPVSVNVPHRVVPIYPSFGDLAIPAHLRSGAFPSCRDCFVKRANVPWFPPFPFEVFYKWSAYDPSVSHSFLLEHLFLFSIQSPATSAASIWAHHHTDGVHVSPPAHVLQAKMCGFLHIPSAMISDQHGEMCFSKPLTP